MDAQTLEQTEGGRRRGGEGECEERERWRKRRELIINMSSAGQLVLALFYTFRRNAPGAQSRGASNIKHLCS